MRVGYGLYFTTNRIIGVDPGSHGGSELTGAMAGYIDGELMPKLSEQENTRIIGELDRVKDFALDKDQIQQIELKNAGSWGFGFGRIKIVPDSGSAISIQLRSRTAFDRLVQLTNAFSPELVRTRPFLSL
jgi:hypothetical protein